MYQNIKLNGINKCMKQQKMKNTEKLLLLYENRVTILTGQDRILIYDKGKGGNW